MIFDYLRPYNKSETVMFLARSGAIAGFDALASELGANPIKLIEATGLSPSVFRNPNTYISYSKMAELMERCARETKEPLFGLLLAERHDMDVLGEIPITISQEKTIYDALKKFDQFLFLHATGAHITLSTSGQDTLIQLDLRVVSTLGINQLLMLSVGDMATLVAKLLNVSRFNLKLHLRQRDPNFRSEIPASGYYSKINFESTFNGVKISTSTLHRPAKMDDAAIRAHIREYQESLKARFPGDLQSQVREIIAQLLPSGDSTITKVAANLDIHPRMLQLKLQNHNTTFSHLLRETRLAIAKEHLSHGRASITDLALSLGYAEVSIFSRQFKSWTGLSPKQFRKKVVISHLP